MPKDNPKKPIPVDMLVEVVSDVIDPARVLQMTVLRSPNTFHIRDLTPGAPDRHLIWQRFGTDRPRRSGQ